MDTEKKLYPMRFCTLEDKYIWGREEFRLADLGYRDSLVHDGWLAGNSLSEVMDMYMDRVTGEKTFEYWGRQFPVTVKHITVSGRMPLRVHPSDSYAAERYDFLGKEKLWYVLRAGKDARLLIGFAEDTDASQLYAACADNSVGDILNIVEPQAGQSFLIPSGVPHAASGDIELIEVSESSPLDFCLCAWGEEVSEEEFAPALSFVDALEFTDYRKFGITSSGAAATLADIPQFKVERIAVRTGLKVKGVGFDSFTVYVCLKGRICINIDVLGVTASYPVNPGEAILIPAECSEFSVIPQDKDSEILDVTVPVRKEEDAYINPDVPMMPEEQ